MKLNADTIAEATRLYFEPLAIEHLRHFSAATKVFCLVAFSVSGLVMLEGKRTLAPPTELTEAVATNMPPAFVETTTPAPTNNPPAGVEEATQPQPVAQSGVNDYTIVKGDNLVNIAKKFHVSVKAITDANPGVEPTKLKIGQQIHILAPAAVAAAAASRPLTENPDAGGEQFYTVHSGDNLTKIATQHGISVKALRAANSLKTDSIRIGQKLNIPAQAASVPTPEK
jgi:LysM repeat protein